VVDVIPFSWARGLSVTRASDAVRREPGGQVLAASRRPRYGQGRLSSPEAEPLPAATTS